LGLFDKIKKHREISKKEKLDRKLWVEKHGIHLTSRPAYARDEGTCIARIDTDGMDRLKVSFGDIIEIYGKKRAFAKCEPLNPSDEFKEIIRTEELTRYNARIVVGDSIKVRRVKVQYADEVILLPLRGTNFPPNEEELQNALYGIPFVVGNIIIADIPLDRKIYYLVLQVRLDTQNGGSVKLRYIEDGVVLTQTEGDESIDKTFYQESAFQGTPNTHYSISKL
tara:strand:+ start:110 stop:781 length:672 start_codon:yes stop_codon:yes gene_type:complete